MEDPRSIFSRMSAKRYNMIAATLEDPSYGAHPVTGVGIAKLMVWVNDPSTDTSVLENILKDLSHSDLIWLMLLGSNGHPHSAMAGKIAWAEFGRRHGFADLKVYMTSTNTEVTVEFVGETGAIHRPKLD